MTSPAPVPQLPSEHHRARFPFKALLALCIVACCAALFFWMILTTPNRDLPKWLQNTFVVMLFGAPVFILVFVAVEVVAIMNLSVIAENRTKGRIGLAALGFFCIVASAVGCLFGLLGLLCVDCAR